MRRNILSSVARAAVALIVLCGVALADEWMAPTTKQYQSANKRFYLEVVPAKRGSGGPAGSPQGTLYRLGPSGKPQKLWTTNLVNEWAPVTAVVSDDGRYVATFDNWYQKGFGNGVVAIYGPGGSLVKSYKLEDIFTKEEIEGFPRSVSSIHWGGEHYIDQGNKRLVLKVVSNGKMQGGSDVAEFREVKLDLATGKLLRD